MAKEEVGVINHFLSSRDGNGKPHESFAIYYCYLMQFVGNFLPQSTRIWLELLNLNYEQRQWFYYMPICMVCDIVSLGITSDG